MSVRRLRAVILAAALIPAVSWSPETGLAATLAGGPDGGPAAQSLTVVSLNLEMREDAGAIVDAMHSIGADAADVLILQEVAQLDGKPSVAEDVAARLGLEATYQPGFKAGANRSIGVATLTCFPIAGSHAVPLKHFSLVFRSRERSALAVTINTPAGPLQTYNVHLDTRINGGDRVDQIAAVVDDLEKEKEKDGRAIVAGDFNTNENFWMFHTVPLPFLGRQGSGLERYMAKHGFRSAFQGGATHDALGMRLDWVFLRDMQPTARAIHPMDISDHHALVVSMR